VNAPGYAVEPLTAKCGHSERCSNPFCNAPMEAKKRKRFCSDRCRMDGYVLRRAAQMLDQVGIVRFNAILKGRLNDVD
jgi:hypothetical protein